MAELIRKRRFPIVGGGGGVWSMVHITDAASATVAAIERGKPGIYHVADDEPAPVRDLLLELARALGAKPPRRVPAWLVRLLAGKGRGGNDDAGPRDLQREGQTRAGLDAAVPELAQGFHRGIELTRHVHLGPVRRAATAGVCDRLPDARQRQRSRGRGAGGVPADAPDPATGRADRLAAGVHRHAGHPAGHRPASLGAGAAGAVCRRVAAGAAGHRSDAGRARRDRRLAVAGVPGAAGELVAAAAGRVPAA